MLIPILIIIIVILAIHVPKNNAKTIIMKEFKSLFEKRLEDPLLPPERTYSNRINIRTQGSEEPYQQIGFVYNLSNSIRMPLFGRRDYIGSDTWEYYVKDNTDNNNVKIQLDNTKELSNDDIVNVTSYNGEFLVEVYNVDQPKYLPNVL